jgi:hypothetical protein
MLFRRSSRKKQKKPRDDEPFGLRSKLSKDVVSESGSSASRTPSPSPSAESREASVLSRKESPEIESPRDSPERDIKSPSPGSPVIRRLHRDRESRSKSPEQTDVPMETPKKRVILDDSE